MMSKSHNFKNTQSSQKLKLGKKCVLIDGNALMHRSYHGVNRGFIPTLDGMPIGMVFGFCSTVLNAMSYFRPDSLIVTFDTKEKTFRHEMDANYKAHREAAPDDFYPQVPFLYEFLEACEVQTLMKPGFESDDLIGTIATEAEKEDYDVYILSGDLDFLQLVSDKVKLAKFNGKLEDSIMYGPVETEARYGIKTDQMIDFKAICGDSSDNYKGVAGVGPKGAEKLLNEFKTLEDIYENLDKLAPKSKEKFEKDRDYVFHCKKLAEIHTSVDIEYEFEKFHFAPETTKEFFEKMNFKSLLGRYEKVLRDYDKPPVEIKKKEPEEDKQMAMF